MSLLSHVASSSTNLFTLNSPRMMKAIGRVSALISVVCLGVFVRYKYEKKACNDLTTKILNSKRINLQINMNGRFTKVLFYQSQLALLQGKDSEHKGIELCNWYEKIYTVTNLPTTDNSSRFSIYDLITGRQRKFLNLQFYSIQQNDGSVNNSFENTEVKLKNRFVDVLNKKIDENNELKEAHTSELKAFVKACVFDNLSKVKVRNSDIIYKNILLTKFSLDASSKCGIKVHFLIDQSESSISLEDIISFSHKIDPNMI